MEVMEEEVAEKKSKEIFIQVAKACSIGAQMTLIMGGGALLFRYLLMIKTADRIFNTELQANFALLCFLPLF